MALKKGTTNPAPKAEAESKNDAKAVEEAKKEAVEKEAEKAAETEQEAATVETAAGPTDGQEKATIEAQKSAEQKAEEAAQAEAEAEEERQKAIEAAKKLGSEFDGTKLVEVYNPQRFSYVQPSTGTRIAGKTQGKLANDSWLQAQLQGRILQEVKG